MKMRISILITTICILSQNLIGQESNHHKLSGGISAEYGMTNHSGYGSFGLDAWIPVKKKFTLNYSIRMGIPGDGIYVRGSAGLMLGGALMGAAGEEGGLTAAIGAITMLIPEGVGVYLGNDIRKLHIGINPLAAEYRHRKNPYDEWSQISGNITIRGELPFNKWGINFISPYFATYYNYGAQNPIGFRLGLTTGFTSK